MTELEKVLEQLRKRVGDWNKLCDEWEPKIREITPAEEADRCIAQIRNSSDALILKKLEQAIALVKNMAGHEGAEGFSNSTRTLEHEFFDTEYPWR